jgi:tetratricopeptide (TPR) repeat protein
MSALLILALLMAAPAQATVSKSAEELTAHCYRNDAGSIDACNEAFARQKAAREQSYLLLAKGMMQSNAKEHAMANAALKQALTLVPRDPYGHLIYGWALDASGVHEAADVQYKQASQFGLRGARDIQADSTIRTLARNIGGGPSFDYTVGQGFERIGQKASAKSFFLEAATEFEKSANPSIIEAYDAAVRVDPTDGETHARLAHFWKKWDDKHGAEVMHQLEEAVRLDPGNADYRYELAHAYIDAGDSTKAVPQLHEALQNRPDFPEAQHDLQMAVISTGEVAAQPAETPDAPEAMKQLRSCVNQDGMRGEIACRRALKIGLSPHNAAEAHTFLAQELSGAAAIAEYHAAIEADPSFGLSYLLLARSVRGATGGQTGEQPDDPATLLATAAKLRPEWIVPRQRLASLLWERKHYEEAIAQQREAAGLDAEDSTLAAKLKEWENDFVSFQEQFRQANAEVQAKPDNIFAQQHLADAAAQVGHNDEARKAYRTVYKMNPHGGWRLASNILYTEFADVACEIYPKLRVEDEPSLATLSALESDLGVCAKKFPRDTTALSRLAKLQAQDGNMALARMTYEDILHRDGAYFDDHPEERVLYDRAKARKTP